MATTVKKTAPVKVETMEAAVALLDKTNAIKEWSSDPSDGVIKGFKEWLEGAPRAWLLGGATPEALPSQLAALDELMRQHVEVSLEGQAEFLEYVIAEPGFMGEDFEADIIAAAPAAHFVRVWLRHRRNQAQIRQEMAKIDARVAAESTPSK